MSKRPKRSRLDSVDAEAIRETLQTRGWKLILTRMQQVHVQKAHEIITQQSEIDTATLRGFITGIETAMRIPAILQSEVKGGVSDG